MTEFKRLLCTTDFSDNSLSGLRYAANLARSIGATIELLHVHHVPLHKSDANAPTTVEDLPAELREELEASLKDMIGELGEAAEGVQIDTSLRVGLPYQQICDHAENSDVDLVIMATLGRTGLARVLMGSVAERVLRLSSKPVLSVK